MTCLKHKILPLFCVLIAFAGLSPAHAADTTVQSIAPGDVLRGRFVQERVLAGFARPLRAEGTFVLIPGSGLIWRGTKPFANTTVITPDGILQLANGEEAMRLPASRLPGISQLYDVLGAALSGNIAPLQRTFAVVKSSAATNWRMMLTPLHPENLPLKSLTLSGSRFVDSVEIDKGGDTDRITFLDQAAMPANLSGEEKSLLGSLHK